MDGTIWIVSYVLLWIAVVVLGFTVIALLRQIGVLHTRVAPLPVPFAVEVKPPWAHTSEYHTDRAQPRAH